MTVRLKTIRLAVAICVLVTLLACGLKTPGDRGTPSPAFTPTREFPVLSPTTDVRSQETPMPEPPQVTAAPQPSLTPAPSPEETFPTPTLRSSRAEGSISLTGAGGEVVQARVTGMRFFPTGNELVPYEQRTYAETFPQVATEYVAWEVSLEFPKPGAQLDFEIYAIWYGPDGGIFTEQTADTYLGADWTSSAHALGTGWVDAGQWTPGAYVVELFVGDKRLASGAFEVVGDAEGSNAEPTVSARPTTVSARPTTGPFADVEVTRMAFFPSDYDLTVYEQRQYATHFEKAVTKYVAWELNLEYPQPGEQVDFRIHAIWYDQDGEVVADQNEAYYLVADWTNSVHALGFGWNDPGQWEPGKYTVELWVDDWNLATGSFWIDDDSAGDQPRGRIAYVSSPEGNSDIWVLEIGGGTTRLTDSQEEDSEPAWSPGGSRVVFYSYRDGNAELYSVNADSSDLVRLTVADSDEWSPVYSPDGRWLAFTSDREGDRCLFVMPATSRESDGSDWTQLTPSDGATWKFDWAPDGRLLVYDSDRDGVRQLYTMPAPDADGVVDEMDFDLLLGTDYDVFDAAWAPDGGGVAFTASAPMANGRIDFIDADGFGWVTLTEDTAGDAAATWSPDGSWIAFTSYREGDGDIFVMPAPGSAAEGAEPINLTRSDGVNDGWPAWAPR